MTQTNTKWFIFTLTHTTYTLCLCKKKHKGRHGNLIETLRCECDSWFRDGWNGAEKNDTAGTMNIRKNSTSSLLPYISPAQTHRLTPLEATSSLRLHHTMRWRRNWGIFPLSYSGEKFKQANKLLPVGYSGSCVFFHLPFAYSFKVNPVFPLSIGGIPHSMPHKRRAPEPHGRQAQRGWQHRSSCHCWSSPKRLWKKNIYQLLLKQMRNTGLKDRSTLSKLSF